MTQTFDIRFARSAGLAALLQVPENVFRWKGGGHIHIDAHGISISVKRGLLALLRGKHTQRIPTENLRAVYREGDALRVEFRSAEDARVVVPFWADDRETAAKIVQLLPTRKTVEIEEATHLAKPRADWRMLLWLFVAITAIAAASWVVYQRSNFETGATAAPHDAKPDVEAQASSPTPAPTSQTNARAAEVPVKPAPPAPWYEAPAIPLKPGYTARTSAEIRTSAGSGREARSATLESDEGDVGTALSTSTAAYSEAAPGGPVVHATPEGIVPFVPGMPEYAAARRQLDLFLAEANAMRGYGAPQDGWWKVAERINNSPDFKNLALKPLQQIELAVTEAWRRADSMPAESAPAEIEFAEMLEARANEFVQ